MNAACTSRLWRSNLLTLTLKLLPLLLRLLLILELLLVRLAAKFPILDPRPELLVDFWGKSCDATNCEDHSLDCGSFCNSSVPLFP